VLVVITLDSALVGCVAQTSGLAGNFTGLRVVKLQMVVVMVIAELLATKEMETGSR
jgi:hypothetical protein